MSSITHRLLVFIQLIFAAVGCAQKVPEISPEQVNQLLDNQENIIIIDVRSEAEFTGELGHIPGAILRPLPEIAEWETEFSKKNEDRFIMVCRSGNRSRRATQYFINHGFSDVQNMSGGMLEWNEQSFPIDKSPGEK